MSEDHRQPKAFVIEDEPDQAPKEKRKPRAVTGISFPPEPEGELVVVPPPVPVPRRPRWGFLLISALLSLVALWAGFSVTQLIEDFFQRSAALGWLATGLAGLAGLAAMAIVFREIWALARLRRIEHIQGEVAHTFNTGDPASGQRALAGLKRLYHNRADALWGLRQLAEHDQDILDPRGRLKLADRLLVQPRDEEAHRVIARTARRVTLLTTVTPAAALDILFVAALNLRMLRELATLYGGRPSALATWRLARMVVSHLAVAGGLALSDSLLQHVVGRGLLGRLSARLGEGTVNGILTARIGLAARDVCRPIPQEASAKETLASLLKEAASFADDAKSEGPGRARTEPLT